MKRSLFVSLLVLFVGSVSAMDKSESNDCFSRFSPVAVGRVITPLSHKDLDTADFGSSAPGNKAFCLQSAFIVAQQRIESIKEVKSGTLSPLTVSAEPTKTA